MFPLLKNKRREPIKRWSTYKENRTYRMVTKVFEIEARRKYSNKQETC